MQLLAVPIAAAQALLALFLLAPRAFRQSSFWVLVALGYLAAYIAQWAGRSVWDPLTYDLGIPQVGAGLVVSVAGRALLAEAFKFAPVLVLGLVAGISTRDWFAWGAAAGTGFGFFVAHQLVAFALEVSRLALSTPALTLLVVVLKVFPILAHAATTAFVAWCLPRGWLFWGLLLATAAQTVLALAERGQAALGPALGNLFFAGLAALVFVGVRVLRDRHPTLGRQPAG
ncbi:MAG: hypothetical protein QN152_07155 [Armatimonadota bacterium]|nr:hypothetical protein [Armatimonadota bacterium]MDR7426927.1 hypothetical protein [Armatimonadota bacterium]MDR7464985.1 hypothetical protein [Armatimonadota bacterium]MDR7470541.1 hypothetical protein [Armatimonadota bacterium]MDR7474192.1 hypothetical protein [Armatimonadota bacterium]